MSKQVNIAECCDDVFFAGDTKIIKLTVEGLTVLTEFAVEFQILSPFWTFSKTRASGITTVDNIIYIRFEASETINKVGEWNYRVRLTSPAGEVSTVAHGIFKLS